MTALPKIVVVFRDASCWTTLLASGNVMRHTTAGVRATLTECGQTLDIPADVQPGWLGIPTDLPAPLPIREAWFPILRGERDLYVRDHRYDAAELAVIAWPTAVGMLHIWTDDNGDHFEVERFDEVTP